MSDGSRSGVHCSRRKSRPSAEARLRAASVLPSPGTSSNSTCPPARMLASATSTASLMPTTTVATRSRIAALSRAISSTGRGSGDIGAESGTDSGTGRASSFTSSPRAVWDEVREPAS